MALLTVTDVCAGVAFELIATFCVRACVSCASILSLDLSGSPMRDRSRITDAFVGILESRAAHITARFPALVRRVCVVLESVR